MKSKNIFFGIFLISIGILWLLKSMDVVSFSWFIFLKLWPLIFIWVGVNLIPIKDIWKVIFNVLVLFMGIVFLFFFSNSDNCKWEKKCWWNKNWTWTCNHDKKNNEHDTVVCFNKNIIAYDNYENANLQLEVAAGKLNFSIGDNLILIQEEEPQSKIIMNSTINDNIVYINANIHPLSKITHRKTCKYDIHLHSAPVWSMNLELNATSGELDLSIFKIKDLTIESNASALDFKLGNLYSEVNVSIESNASSVDIRIPRDMQCTLRKAENNLSAFSVKGLKQESKNKYISEDEGDTVGVINLIIESNVSSVDIKRY